MVFWFGVSIGSLGPVARFGFWGFALGRLRDETTGPTASAAMRRAGDAGPERSGGANRERSGRVARVGRAASRWDAERRALMTVSRPVPARRVAGQRDRAKRAPCIGSATAAEQPYLWFFIFVRRAQHACALAGPGLALLAALAACVAAGEVREGAQPTLSPPRFQAGSGREPG